MAFPGTYNINYYKGDTFEFRIFPKDANGAAFPLNNFTSAKFTIAAARGSSTLIEGYAVISQDNQSIECAITPAVSSQLLMSQSPYVYDVEIGRDSSPYDIIYTLLTGTITLTDQVTPLTDISPPEVVVNIPNNPTGLTNTVTNDSITIGWTEPTTGDDPDEYNLYILPYTVDPVAITAALAGDPTDTIDAPATSHTFDGLDSETQYLVIAAALSSSSIGAQWTAPETGGTVGKYKVYIMEYTTDPVQIAIGYAAGPVAEIDAPTTQHLFTGLNPETGYLIAIRSSNVTGDAPIETALTNLLTGAITTPAEES